MKSIKMKRPRRKRKPKDYKNMRHLSDDDKINLIVEKLRDGDTVAVVVDSDPGKLEAWTKKIHDAVSGQIEISYEGEGPVAGTRMAKIKMVLG